ncbi:helix-turn-helix domain-containing protein [Pseudonocardia sp.]|uniref:helix-turn-helix domain-containing protein n=1 Tax=Pseudonocardia sp. TaxID=60912 RepID=UPI003D12B7E1
MRASAHSSATGDSPQGPDAGTTADAGALVRRARVEAGVSLRELARRIDVSPGTVSAVENGKTQLTYTRLQQIAAALGRTAPELLLDVNVPAWPVAAEGTAEPTDLHELRRIYSELGTRSDGAADWRRYEPIPIGPVLLAGLAVFVETGYHGATVRTIADAAGMSVSGIYHYCTSKHDILVRLLDEAMTDLAWRTRAAVAEGTTAAERTALLVESLAQYHAQRWAFGLILAVEMRSLEPADRARIRGLRDDERHRLEACIEAGIADGTFTTTSATLTARAIMTMCTALPEWYRPGGPLSPAELGRRYAAMALDMAGAVTRPAGPAAS